MTREKLFLDFSARFSRHDWTLSFVLDHGHCLFLKNSKRMKNSWNSFFFVYFRFVCCCHWVVYSSRIVYVWNRLLLLCCNHLSLKCAHLACLVSRSVGAWLAWNPSAFLARTPALINTATRDEIGDSAPKTSQIDFTASRLEVTLRLFHVLSESTEQWVGGEWGGLKWGADVEGGLQVVCTEGLQKATSVGVSR